MPSLFGNTDASRVTVHPENPLNLENLRLISGLVASILLQTHAHMRFGLSAVLQSGRKVDKRLVFGYIETRARVGEGPVSTLQNRWLAVSTGFHIASSSC